LDDEVLGTSSRCAVGAARWRPDCGDGSGAGAVVTRYTYNDPCGTDVDVNGSLQSDPYRFAGQYFDTETGLYEIGARYYAPGQGRWTQPDPINQAFDPRQAHRYAYAGDDPVNRQDPQGTDSPIPSVCYVEESIDDYDAEYRPPHYGGLPEKKPGISALEDLGNANECFNPVEFIFD
jgi:RHS repeat-associated protein